MRVLSNELWGSAMPSRVFPSRHVYISIVVWDSIYALRSLFGVASDVHFIPTTHDFHSPRVASFRDRLAFIYGVRAFVCVRCPCAFGGSPCRPKFSLRDMLIFLYCFGIIFMFLQTYANTGTPMVYWLASNTPCAGVVVSNLRTELYFSKSDTNYRRDRVLQRG